MRVMVYDWISGHINPQKVGIGVLVIKIHNYATDD